MSKKREPVNVGQIYEDMDRRARGRRVRIVDIRRGSHATVENVANSRRTIIAVLRLQSSDYRLVRVADPKKIDDGTNVSER